MPVYAQDGFTGEDLLGWSDASKAQYVRISMTMASVIATQIDPEAAQCINEWYFGDDALQIERNAFVFSTLEDHARFHPTAVITAILQRECLAFQADN